jgi:hypothetical protein
MPILNAMFAQQSRYIQLLSVLELAECHTCIMSRAVSLSEIQYCVVKRI